MKIDNASYIFKRMLRFNLGYHFAGWSDGNSEASRQDTNIEGNINVSAGFELYLPDYSNTTPAAVRIIGTEKVDNTLEAQLIDVDGVNVTTSAAVSYKWYRIPSKDSEDGTLIGENKTYRLVSDDIGSYIKLVVSYIDEAFERITSKILGEPSNSNTNSSGTKNSNNSSTQQITVKVTDGSSDNSVSQTVIERITASDGSKKDTVTYSADKARETIAALTSAGKDTARIVATDSDASVAETQINIPKETLSALSIGNVNLEIETKVKDTWFHLGTDYKMNTGWFKDTDGSWYFLCDGKSAGALGVMETGWKFTNDKWYFLKDNGSMATGWTQVDGKWYYLQSDGSMASNTVVDGYTLDNSGAWVN